MIYHPSKYLQTHFRFLIRVTFSDLEARYAGSIVGILWAFLSPLLLFATYAIIYQFIFKIRVPEIEDIAYVKLILTGMAVFQVFSEAITSSLHSISVNKAIFLNTVFPIDLAPVKAVLISQISMVSGVLAILAIGLYNADLSWTILLFPFFWILYIMFLMGIGWIIAVLGMVVKDFQYFIGFMLSMLAIASPIAYTQAMIPTSLTFITSLNLFAYYMIVAQKLLALGELPTVNEGLIVVLLSLSFYFVGGWIFVRTKGVAIDYV